MVGFFGGSLFIGVETSTVPLGLLTMVLPMVSGFHALRKRHWKLALAGAIFIILFFPFTGIPVFSILFFPVIGILISIILIKRKGEFDSSGIKHGNSND